MVLETILPQLQFPLISVLSRDWRNGSIKGEKFRFVSRSDILG